MDADDESSRSPSSKTNVANIPALVKQVVTQVLAEQAENHPDNRSQSRQVKKATFPQTRQYCPQPEGEERCTSVIDRRAGKKVESALHCTANIV